MKIIQSILKENLGEETYGWYITAVGYPGMTRNSSPRFAIAQEYTSQYLTQNGEWDRPMGAVTFMSREEAEKFAEKMVQAGKLQPKKLKEDGAVGGGTGMGMSVTGAVQGYNTPRAFEKKKNVDETEGGNDFIEGQSNQVAAKRVNGLLAALTKGIHSDTSWEAINKIFAKLKEAGLDVYTQSAQYGGKDQLGVAPGMPTYKEWKISIPFTNNKGKPTELVGQITAHGAGSVEDPMSRYDITAYVTAVPKKGLGEAEIVDPTSGEIAPGPRDRFEMQPGGSVGRKPIPKTINKAKVQKALAIIGNMKNHEWRPLLDRARKNYQLFPDDGIDSAKLNLAMALQWMDENPSQSI